MGCANGWLPWANGSSDRTGCGDCSFGLDTLTDHEGAPSAMKILKRLGKQKNRWLFERAARAILQTAPIRPGSAPLTVLSMCNHRDVQGYLLALKSFMMYVPARRVVLVADPTLTREDEALIASHVPGIDIKPLTACRDPRTPSGGCWERITAIADEVQSSYVVQLDADTVTLNALPEVTECAVVGDAFLLASDGSTRILSCSEMADIASARWTDDAHIQGVAEARLGAFSRESWRYARACAAFTGFPKGSFSRDSLAQVSEVMHGAVGERWSEWGSEQVTSNLIAASHKTARVLPHPKYCNANYATAESALLHFIGYVRFASTAYSDRARDAIRRFAV